MRVFQNSSDLFSLSFRRKPESSEFKVFWTPVFTGVTVIGTPEQVSIVSTLMKRYTSARYPFLPHTAIPRFPMRDIIDLTIKRQKTKSPASYHHVVVST